MIANNCVVGGDNLLTPLESLVTHSEILVASSVVEVAPPEGPVSPSEAKVVSPVNAILWKPVAKICQSSSSLTESEFSFIAWL